eukprot:1930727-Alexandrium_andersonii.AAC.1
MSASLVGSEMCIRDSLPEVRLRTLVANACWKAWGVGDGLVPLGCRTDCCLLYTSDAADDM